jgi:hypothetical protein
LGLGKGKNPYFKYDTEEEWVALIYCSKFQENTPLYQPNTTHADWWNDFPFFLSYRHLDSHGRTYNETEIAKIIKATFKTLAKEKVHTPSNYFSDKFYYVDLGTTAADDRDYLIEEDIPLIITEAYNRLLEI